MGRTPSSKNLADKSSGAVISHQPSHRLAYSIAGAVHATGLSRTRLYQLAAHGKLTLRRAGRRTVILADDLEAVIRSLPLAPIRQHSDDTTTY